MNKKVEAAETKEEEVKVPSKFKQEDLLAIFDQIMFEGGYSETIKLRGKLPVTFKTRTVEETLEISKKIDSIQANLISTINEQRAVFNLAYSITDYNGKDLSKSDLTARLDFIKKLPVPVIAAMSDALAKFDEKVDAACKEGEENF